jgi:CTP synthase
MADKKYIFVTGGVCSSLGKGIAAASIGVLLKAAGYKINMMKIDPYLNVDAGTMSPYQHGEVYVTNDGAETDLDLGNYERFVRVETSKLSSLTTGQVYQTVIDAERRGDYLGETVQVIPHITDEIKRRIRIVDEGKDSDIIIVELGGTVGDIEGLPFIEAVRQFSHDEGRNNVKFAHLTLVPMIAGSGELKTKPSQHSVKELMGMGIQPDFLFCRAEVMLPLNVKSKMALFCNMEENCIFSAIDVKNIHEVPLVFHQQGADKMILEKMGLPYKKPELTKWKKMTEIASYKDEMVNIAMVGKYINLEDTYKSVDAALKHGGIANKVGVNIIKVDAEYFETENFEDGILERLSVDHFEEGILEKIPNVEDKKFVIGLYQKDKINNYYLLSDCVTDDDKKKLREIFRFIGYKGLISKEIDGILIPGGFGSRGVEGKIKAIRHAREKKIPILGICLGLQCMVIEYSRNVCQIQNAHSREFEPTAEDPVIELLTNLKGIKYMGGTMRKGAAKSRLKPNSLANQVYGKEVIEERHRHRYEVNPEYVETLEKNGLVISAHAEGGLVEMIELKDHPWFLGGQFHPEFKSSPIDPHPIFVSFIAAADQYRKKKG